MALKVTQRPIGIREEGTMSVVADKNLYVNRDFTKIVPEGSPESAFLLAAKGQTVRAEFVKKLGLDKKVVKGSSPTANKAVAAGANK